MPLLYADLDVSLQMTSVCVLDADDRIVFETKVASEPGVIAGRLGELSGAFERVGPEAGPLSQGPYFGLRDAGYQVVRIETPIRRPRFAAMSMKKTDRNDARSSSSSVGLV